MSSATVSPLKKAGKTRLNLRVLHAELQRLRERVEDLEDLRELNEALARNQGKKLVPWAAAKRHLGLTD